MKIGTCQSQPGTIQNGFLKISHKNKRVQIPISILEGTEKGKTAFISAGMHGDELNGINIVSNFIKSINPQKIKGTIIFIPVINPLGFHHGERKIKHDDKDLNRCFGKTGNTISYKIAQTLFNEVFSKCDFGLDFHDSNKRNVLLPHTRIFEKENKRIEELSHIFGTEIVMKRKASKGMLALEAMNLKQIPVLTIETSGGMRISPTFTKQAIQGINNILIHEGFIKGTINLPKKQFILDERIGYRSNYRGILTINKKLGDPVEKEEIVAQILNPTQGKTAELKAQNSGILFSIKSNAHIKANQKAFSILHLKQQNGKIVPIQGKMIENTEDSTTKTNIKGSFNKALELMKNESKNFFQTLKEQGISKKINQTFMPSLN